MKLISKEVNKTDCLKNRTEIIHRQPTFNHAPHNAAIFTAKLYHSVTNYEYKTLQKLCHSIRETFKKIIYKLSYI